MKIIVSICRQLSCLFSCKKSTSSLTSFLKYCREIANLLFWVIWACLAQITQLIASKFEEAFDIYLQAKNQLYSSHFPSDIGKILQNLLFWVPWACLATHTQSDTIHLQQKTFLFKDKKRTSSPMLVWIYCKDIQTFYFGYFGHAWLCTPNINL